MGRRARRSAATVLLGLALAGCAIGQNYKRPFVPVPERFYGDERAAEARSLADVPWWDVFDDPILKGLIEEALRNGFDARLAAARVQEAQARFGIARSQFFPSVDYEGGWERARPDQIVNPSGDTQTRWTVDAGFSWELDLWGRIRRLNEAALAAYLATEEGRRGVLLSLVSDVAIAYIDLRELDRELEIARSTTTAFQGTYDLFNRRLEGRAASRHPAGRAGPDRGERRCRRGQGRLLPAAEPHRLLRQRQPGAPRPLLAGQDLESRRRTGRPDLPGRTNQARLR